MGEFDLNLSTRPFVANQFKTLLLVVALIVQVIPDARVWTVPIIGFALLYWALPYVREGAWRVGAGDSGNRILAHYLAVSLIFLVLAAVHNRGVASADRVESV